MTTIPALLESKMYRYNKSFLAKDLKVTRNTLRKYSEDEKGEFHVVVEFDERIELFTNQTRKK